MEIPEHYQRRAPAASPRQTRRRRDRSDRYSGQRKPQHKRPLSLDGALSPRGASATSTPLSKPQRQATLEPVKREPQQPSKTTHAATAGRNLQRNLSNPELTSPTSPQDRPAVEREFHRTTNRPKMPVNSDLDFKESIHSLGALERVGSADSNHDASFGSGNTSRWSAFSQGTGNATLNTTQLEQISIVPRFPRRQKTGENMPTRFRQRKLRSSAGSSSHANSPGSSKRAGAHHDSSSDENNNNNFNNSGGYATSPSLARTRPQLPNRQKSFGKSYSLDQAVKELSKRQLLDLEGDSTSLRAAQQTIDLPKLNRQMSPLSAAPHKPRRASSILGDDALFRQKSEPDLTHERRRLPQRSRNNTSLSVTMHAMRMSERSLTTTGDHADGKAPPGISTDKACVANTINTINSVVAADAPKSKMVYDTPRWVSTPPIPTNRASRRTNQFNIRRVKSDGWKMKMPPRMMGTLDTSTQSQTTSDDSSRMPDSSSSGRFDFSGMARPILPKRQVSTSEPPPSAEARRLAMTDGSMADISNQTGFSEFSLDSFAPQLQQQLMQPIPPNRAAVICQASDDLTAPKSIHPISPRRVASDSGGGGNGTPKIPRRQVSDDPQMPAPPITDLSILNFNKIKSSPMDKSTHSASTRNLFHTSSDHDLNGSKHMPNKPKRQNSGEVNFVSRIRRNSLGSLKSTDSADTFENDDVNMMNSSKVMPSKPQRQTSGEANYVPKVRRKPIASLESMGSADTFDRDDIHRKVAKETIRASSPKMPRRQESSGENLPPKDESSTRDEIDDVDKIRSPIKSVLDNRMYDTAPVVVQQFGLPSRGETQFLESRALRQKNTDSAQQNLQTEKRGSALSAFRERFEHEVNSWQQQLNVLLSASNKEDVPNESKESSHSLAERRTKLRVTISELQDDLDSLRKHSLSTASTGGSAKFHDWDLPSEIPPTELRLLHEELTKCATELEKARDSLLPKAKFVFHRYRQERLRQEAQEEGRLASGATDGSQSRLSPATDKALVLPKGPLEDVQSCSIGISAAGEVKIQPIQDFDAQRVEQNGSPLSVAGKSSLVIRNVHHSSVIL